MSAPLADDKMHWFLGHITIMNMRLNDACIKIQDETNPSPAMLMLVLDMRQRIEEFKAAVYALRVDEGTVTTEEETEFDPTDYGAASHATCPN